MGNWIRRLFSERVSVSAPDYSSYVPELVALPWTQPIIELARAVDPEWLLVRLGEFQSPFVGEETGSLSNASSLAGDLFAAGLEHEQLAWLYAEAQTEREEVERALRDCGIGLIPDNWLSILGVQAELGRYLQGTRTLSALSSAMREGFHTEMFVEFSDLVWDVDYLDDKGDTQRARTLVLGVVPILEERRAEMVSRVRSHISASAASD